MAKSNTPIFAVGKYEDILSGIQSGILTYPSYVICTDDYTWVFVDKELNLRRIKGYEQEAIIHVSTLPTTKFRTDAIYICNGTGYIYINSVPVPIFNNNGSSVASYDQLESIPITNKYGQITSPIVLADLDNGSYSISGQYKIGGYLDTIFVTSSRIMFLIDSDEENKYITKLDAKNICVYTVSLDSMEVVEDKYSTESWVLAQGYTNRDYVNQAITDLYNKIVNDALVDITKVSQLENDIGYITADDIHGISNVSIANLF